MKKNRRTGRAPAHVPDLQEQLQTRIMELIEVAVVVFDHQGTVIYLNAFAKKLYGWEAPHVLGRPIVEVTSPQMSPEQTAEIVQALREGRNWSGEIWVRHKDGSKFLARVGATPVRDEKGDLRAVIGISEDITARKRSEEQIHYQANLLANVSDAVIATDMEFNIVYWNAAAEALYGWKAEEVQGRSFHELAQSEIIGATREAAVRHVLEDGRWQGRVLQRTKGREPLQILSSVALLKDAQGTLTGFLAVNRDISELTDAQRSIKQYSKRLEQAEVYGRLGSWDFDLQTGQGWWSKQMYAFFGFEARETVPDVPEYLERIHPEDRPIVQDVMTKMAEGREVVPRMYRTNPQLGPVRYLSPTVSLIRDEQGQPVRYAGTLLDITERYLAEEKIQRQLDHLNALREIDQAIASSTDFHSSLEVVIHKMIRLLSIDAATILLIDPVSDLLYLAAGRGFRTQEIYTARVKIDESYAGRAVLEQRMIQIPDLRGDPNNRFRTGFLKGEDFVSYYGVPLIAKGRAMGVMEVFDRTPVERDPEWFDILKALAGQAALAIDNGQLFERLQHSKIELEHRVAERTAELNRVNAELERANRTKGEFLATMSHELRTPLNSILGMTESLLEQRRDPLTGRQQKSLELVESSGRHLLDLINDILDLSKIEAGKLDYYPEPIRVADLCNSSLAFVKSQAIKKSIDLQYDDDGTASSIHADPRRLKQVLVNLLSNAVKFTPSGGQVTLQVRASVEEDVVQFSVIDNGIGIALQNLTLLFQPFTQVDSRLNRQEEGTGLGLALVQRLIDLHGGSVRVESEPGKGSSFTVLLPWRRQLVEQAEGVPAEAAALAGQTAPSAVQPKTAGTLLLAEDNMANILTVGEYLESHGYDVRVAHDGFEAIKMAESLDPGLILMDVQMPAMDGLEAIRRLRANPRFAGTPIIALTALAMPGDRERCLQAGANEYISKPASLKRLVETIRQLWMQGEGQAGP